MRTLRAIVVALFASVMLAAAEPFELKDGERVVLIGNTLIEREQKYGYWEAALTARWPDRNITFRNLGWSGDTVWGEARAGFDTPVQGFKRLVEHTLALKPTVIVVGYGGNEAFDGATGLKRFEEGLKKLLDALASAKARVVILSPPRVQETKRSLPDATSHNANLALYRKALRLAATAGGHKFVDLYELSEAADWLPGWTLTDNGLHFSAEGYRYLAALVEHGLGLPERKNGALSEKQLLHLRQTIIAKNEQFFHRWRPQNETYLFGFRKHEQGKNAAEIPLFDPVIEKLEKEIARLRKPIPHTYELKRVEK